MPLAALDRLIAATTPSPSPSPSASPSPSPSPSPLPTTPAEIADSLRNAIEARPACSPDDISVCGITLRITGSERTAQIVSLLLGKPLEIALRLAILVVLAVLIRRALHRGIDRFVDRVIERPVEEQRHPLAAGALAITRREQRARTLASVLKSLTTGVIGVVVLITVMGTLGFPIGGLLASAGVVGVALGFGCQALVRDFVSGIFMIIEDQYGVGDNIDAGEASGTVEAVGLRVTRLRDVNGTVWYVRNGEILRVGNNSQGWSRAVLDVSVAYGEDIDRVQDLLQGAAAELRHDTRFSAWIMEEPEVWGIERMTPEAVVVRVVVKTQPLQQWAVARELRRRFIQVLASNGITLPAQPWAGGPVDSPGTAHVSAHPAAPAAEPPAATPPPAPAAAPEGEETPRSGNQQDQDVEQRPRATGSVGERPAGS